jgi:hypothetical protein
MSGMLEIQQRKSKRSVRSTKLARALNRVSVLNEKPLHAALKEWYAQPGDLLEVSVDGYVADIARGHLLVEIQTRNFAAIKQKLALSSP